MEGKKIYVNCIGLDPSCFQRVGSGTVFFLRTDPEQFFFFSGLYPEIIYIYIYYHWLYPHLHQDPIFFFSRVEFQNPAALRKKNTFLLLLHLKKDLDQLTHIFVKKQLNWGAVSIKTKHKSRCNVLLG